MDNKIVIFTFFTLSLLTVSAARLVVDPPATNPSAIWSGDALKQAKTSHGSALSVGSNILLPGEKVKSDSDETTANNRLPEKEQNTNDLTPGTKFTRFHHINRHFNDKPRLGPKQIGTHRRPCHKYVRQYRIPRTEVSDRKDEITAVRSDNFKSEKDEITAVRSDNSKSKKDEITAFRSDKSKSATFRGEVPSNWLKVKHHYRSRGHHNKHRNNDDNVIKTNHVFDREKMKSLIRQHEQKKRDEEAGLMKSIRKFLKHTFD